jgi:hypothetical protein
MPQQTPGRLEFPFWVLVSPESVVVDTLGLGTLEKSVNWHGYALKGGGRCIPFFTTLEVVDKYVKANDLGSVGALEITNSFDLVHTFGPLCEKSDATMFTIDPSGAKGSNPVLLDLKGLVDAARRRLNP